MKLLRHSPHGDERSVWGACINRCAVLCGSEIVDSHDPPSDTDSVRPAARVIEASQAR